MLRLAEKLPLQVRQSLLLLETLREQVKKPTQRTGLPRSIIALSIRASVKPKRQSLQGVGKARRLRLHHLRIQRHETLLVSKDGWEAHMEPVESTK